MKYFDFILFGGATKTLHLLADEEDKHCPRHLPQCGQYNFISISPPKCNRALQSILPCIMGKTFTANKTTNYEYIV